MSVDEWYSLFRDRIRSRICREIAGRIYCAVWCGGSVEGYGFGGLGKIVLGLHFIVHIAGRNVLPILFYTVSMRISSLIELTGLGS